MVKKWLLGILIGSFIAIAWNFSLLKYGFLQAKGQIQLILNTIPIEEVLENKTYPDSIHQKIKLIEEIKQFAFDSLGIKKNNNYSTFYDQKGKPILWVVTACPPFEMKAYEWSFPILGKVSYKGFFDKSLAEKEAENLRKLGFETDIGEVSAWSTLGWLNDPILSSMLKRKPGSLANLIIHELTHGTLYVKDNVEFNENLASFVGDYGAKKFLLQKYGEKSIEFADYEKGLINSKAYAERTLYWAMQLDSLYKQFPPAAPMKYKQQQKDSLFLLAQKNLIQLLIAQNNYSKKTAESFKSMNNTYFVDYMTYRVQQNQFEETFTKKFNCNFPAYMEYLKKTYPSL